MRHANTLEQEVKRRTAEHWAGSPIGTRTSGFHAVHEEFSREWFEEQARFRYDVYAPWMRGVAGFDRHRGDLVLEVGCGMGTDLLEFARGGARVVGLDLTPRHLDLAERRFRLFGLPGRFFLGDAERLPFPGGRFDFVYTNGVLHHTPDTAGAIREIHRVLKPGGSATIILYHRDSLVYRVRICAQAGGRDLASRILGRGGRLRDFTFASLLNRSTDGPTNPLTKVFSAADGRRMCRDFANVVTRIVHLNPGDVAFLRWLPPAALAALARRWGWYLVIEATR